MALSLVSWFASEKQIGAGEGNASACGGHGALHLGLSGFSEVLALWGRCPRATRFGWLSSMEQHGEHPSSPGRAALTLLVCLSISAASALLPLAVGI